MPYNSIKIKATLVASLKNKNLTKGLAMICLECPRKLYYHNNPQIYQNNNSNLYDI